MTSYPHPVIAREGWPFLAVSVLAGLAVGWLAGAAWSLPLWIWTVFVLQFFRDPARPVPGGEKDVLSPADGRIVAIERTRDPYLDREALKINVFMNVFNVHSNRSPVDGEVKGRWYHAGSFLNAALDKASLENERNAIWLRTKEGWDVTSVQVAGLVARRILCYVNEDDRLARGQRYGFIRFGSRVDVYLPIGSMAKITIGEKVSATSTILAELP